MTDYSKMSDFEINVAVSLELFEGSSGGDVSRIATWCACEENGDYGLFDPCNSPADAWPIIIRNLISIDSIFDKGNTWLAFGGDDSEHRHVHSNPLRAAMVVFLMMKETEQCSS
ncbi:DUF2591 family protein [Serratia nevei]|uniref:phage protein NinX family protein n=1 Tax=Serratia nevei TaxID=2703794 RepID=UPI00313F3971